MISFSFMNYISTRGQTPPMSFSDAVMTGLAPDGGLLVPESIPVVSRGTLDQWASLTYSDLAFEVMKLFVDLPDSELRRIVDTSYSVFTDPEVTPVKRVGDVYILELFHGPTLAFKDIALQFLGNLFEYILSGKDCELNILAATSGDTGSAAIHGVRGRDKIRIFVMHPKGRTSITQALQMITVLDDNVFNMAINGTFDDCQAIMKSVFNDLDFKHSAQLGTVNSINWARVLAQIVYYFYSGLKIMKSTRASRVDFSVPTGNFGDIFAGYIAARMGLPVGKLILATNENDILCRFFNSGEYSAHEVVKTLSPSMDIQVASNFERYLFYRFAMDSEQVRQTMSDFIQNKAISVPVTPGECVDPLFSAASGDTQSTLAIIKEFYETEDYLLDPHTAVGVYAARECGVADRPVICLATAHPAKFGDAISRAVGHDVAHHPGLEALRGRETRCTDIPNDVQAVKDFIKQSLN
jgi:threonine synthase